MNVSIKLFIGNLICKGIDTMPNFLTIACSLSNLQATSKMRLVYELLNIGFTNHTSQRLTARAPTGRNLLPGSSSHFTAISICPYFSVRWTSKLHFYLDTLLQSPHLSIPRTSTSLLLDNSTSLSIPRTSISLFLNTPTSPKSSNLNISAPQYSTWHWRTSRVQPPFRRSVLHQFCGAAQMHSLAKPSSSQHDATHSWTLFSNRRWHKARLTRETEVSLLQISGKMSSSPGTSSKSTVLQRVKAEGPTSDPVPTPGTKPTKHSPEGQVDTAVTKKPRIAKSSTDPTVLTQRLLTLQ